MFWKRFTSLCLTCLFLMAFVLPLRSSATDATDEMDALIKAYNRPTAVMVYNMDGTMLYSYNAATKMSGASLIKLPYCYYVCAQLENGFSSLDATMTYTEKWYHSGSGIIYKGAYGEVYTVAQLLDYALRYSDNVAYDMLVEIFGMDGFNAMVKRWGFSDIYIGNQTLRFPLLPANFVCESMRRFVIRSDDGGPWELAWDALCHSKDTYVRAVLGDENTPVAVKYGNIPKVWHEACYIGSDSPYILILMSSATNYVPDVTYLQNVAACAGRINEEHAAEVRALVPPETTEAPTETVETPTEPTEIPTETEEITTEPTEPVESPQFGDVIADGSIDAVDAQAILQAAANLGSGREAGLSAEQLLRGDLNGNSLPDAEDAALLLQYAAYSGAGGSESLTDFLAGLS